MKKQKKENYYIEYNPENVGTRRVAFMEGEAKSIYAARRVPTSEGQKVLQKRKPSS